MIKKQEVQNRLFVRIIDNSKPVVINEQGQRLAETKWIEVGEVNLGSLKNPNREILEFRFEPLVLEKKETPKLDLNEFFKKFGMDLE